MHKKKPIDSLRGVQMEKTENKKLPPYLKEVYGWIYGSKRVSGILDNAIVQNVLSCGYSKKLTDALVKEIKPGARVLQFGATFGPQIEAVVEKIGDNGIYDIVDVSNMQLHRIREKYQYIFPNIRLANRDVSQYLDLKDYDVTICYMLLHEVPPQTKARIVDNALKSIAPDGKVIFVDYHSPKKYHPLRYVTKAFNRLYQPFAEKLWEREIYAYAPEREKYNWRKATYFDRMYQKVVATKKYSAY